MTAARSTDYRRIAGPIRLPKAQRESRQIMVAAPAVSFPAPTERDSEIPQIQVDAEPGSEAWCEQMMNVPNADWSREDSQTFADQCIYD